jgi:hypothetical protein
MVGDRVRFYDTVLRDHTLRIDGDEGSTRVEDVMGIVIRIFSYEHDGHTVPMFEVSFEDGDVVEYETENDCDGAGLYFVDRPEADPAMRARAHA